VIISSLSVYSRSTLARTKKRKEGKCRNFICNSNADKISLVYHTHETKRRKEQNEKKNRLAIKSGNSKKYIREICAKKPGRLRFEDLWKRRLVLSLEWNRDEVVHSESHDNDGDDHEPVRERSDDGGKHSSSTGWRSSLGSSFQRRGE